MKKFIKKIIIFIIILSLIISIPYIIILALPPVYSSSYTAAIIDKYERLKSIDEPKIIMIAGSNYSFGIDSETIEEAFGMPVVNMGLHISYGMETVFSYVKNTINEGDIIILGLEYDVSMEGVSGLMCNSIENNLELLSMVPVNMYLQTANDYLHYGKDKIKILSTEGERIYQGLYSRAAFNQYGDIGYSCENNKMENGYLADSKILITPNDSLVEMINSVNKLNNYIRKKGAYMYYSFPSVNELSLEDESNIPTYLDFLKNNLKVPIISEISDYIFESKYFYDTNYHLNDEGTRLRTQLLIRDMKEGIPLLKNNYSSSK
ncbi:MAG: hypothetical protein AB1Z23_09720 [Eubacteriales bacterium]